MEGICQRCGESGTAESAPCARCGSVGGRDTGALLPGEAPDLPPRFRPKRLLGRGGMGRVYLCEDRDLEVDVAVKLLPRDLVDDPKSMELIEREARVAARLRGCAGILQLYEFDHHEGIGYIVMEFAPGGSLQAALARRGPLPEGECRRIGARVADALAFAHDRRVLHRDVKPANLLLGEDGEARVADFGLARVLLESSTRSTHGLVAGTPVYLPPEVIDRRKPDNRADLYSLGCVLYEIAAGVPAFEGTFAEIAMAKARRPARAPDPRERRGTLSAEYATVVATLLAWDPVERYGDGRQVAAILRGEAEAAPRGVRTPLLSPLPVDPAVRGLPPPPNPVDDGTPLPERFAVHAGRVYCLRDGSEMALVPAGPFTMGSDHGHGDEAPSREVHLSSYLVDRHEVTVWQFSRFARETRRAMPEQPPGSNDLHPVVNVTWGEARAYAEWAGKALPTEAQWERAARGTDGRSYPWGNEPPGLDRARARNPEEGLTTVCSFPGGQSPAGCLDMVGNAWEWVADWYAPDAYASCAARDPTGPRAGTSRVLRGGILGRGQDEDLRVTRRRRVRPESRYAFVGFRCVRDLAIRPMRTPPPTP